MEFPIQSEEYAMDHIVVEEASIALVREFLNRKGCKNSLSALDDELPRGDASICNRAELAQTLHIAPLIRKNKSLTDPFRTIIEIIVWDVIKKHKKLTNENQSKLTRPSTAKAKLYSASTPTGPETLELKDVNFENNADVSKPMKYGQFQDSMLKHRRQQPESTRKTRSYNPSINPMIISGLRVSNSLTKHRQKKASSVAEMLSASPDKIISSHDTISQEDEKKKTKNVVNSTDHTEKSTDTNSAIVPENKTHLRNSSDRYEQSSPGKKKQDTVLVDFDDEEWTEDSKCEKWISGLDKLSFKYNTNKSNEVYHAQPQQKVLESRNESILNKNQKPQKISRKVGFNLPQSGMPLDFQSAVKLRKIVFGSASVRGFPEQWINQSFMFRDCKDERTVRLRFGIIQKKGGPCGLLAAVQSYVLKHLLFGKVGNDGSEIKKAEPSALNCKNEIRTSCLAEAIIEILWQAGGGRRAVVALLSNRQSFSPTGNYKEDSITEFIVTKNCQSLESLHHTIYNSISQFESGRGAAILLLYSAILSRGIGEVTSDMDDPGNILMGAHSYCTQEMVNLLTLGFAISNTFNDTVQLDGGLILKGAKARSNIGLLSLFEHYGSCTVGSYLKTPRYPIWIVCSESHFSVLFCLNRDLVNDWTVERLFDLYYYDGLANQDEEMRLTVNTMQKPQPKKDNDLIPPLELCIQTKWPDSVIDWNGTDPLL
ncbi:putative ubiquitin carboxyl-terminal hydrolase MINDY-4 [Styela clava]